MKREREMSLNVVYKKLTQEYCKDIVELHSRSFNYEHISRTIYASPKIHSYLASLMAFPEFQHEHILFGGLHNNELVSYAYFRTLDDSFHLNNIAVSPSFQGLGIGKAMMEIFRTLAIDYDCSKLSLRVSGDNETAYNWYKRLGFEQKQKTYIYEQMLRHGENDYVDGVELYGWENAQAWHNSYGFSNFEVRNGNDCWKIMRLNDSYFRVNGYVPTIIRSVLNILDPRRKLLILSNSPLNGPRVKLLEIDYWMEANMDMD